MNKFDGSISLYIDKKTNVSTPMNIPSRKPSIWIPNEKINKCFKCKSDFNTWNRKHHCRSCGRIFCSECLKWYSEKSDYITSTTPPQQNYLQSFLYNKNTLKTCEECNKYHSTTVDYKTELIIFIHLPITISQLIFLRSISKKWCKIINYIIRIYRSIQYKLPSQKCNKIEKIILWNHRFEFKHHYFWISKCLTYNSHKNKEEIKKYIDYLKNEEKDKKYTCNSLLCTSNCRKSCKPENILELGFNIDLSNHLPIQKYIVHLLNNKTLDFYKLLMPWLVELSKKYLELGLDIAYKCAIDEDLFYSFYFEAKYYLNTLNKNDNKNLKIMMKKINTFVIEEVRNNIRKTDQFLKFIQLLIQKTPYERKEMTIQWFNQNGYVKMPWNTELLCIGIQLDNIKQLSSASKPFLIPLLVKKHYYTSYKVIHILVKNEDLRKDKLTMFVSQWLKNICDKDVAICTYNILPYNLNYGWVEIIENCSTLYDISHKHNKTLQNYIMDLNDNISVQEVRFNFIRSCVSSCVLSYIMGLGDRHQENILVNRYGELVHIDFSYLLGEDPKNAAVEMKITPEMLTMLGGKSSRQFIIFKKHCERVYKIVRGRSSLWYLLLSFLAFNKPEIKPYHNNYDFIKRYVINRLVPGEFDDVSSMQINEIVERSSDSSWTEFISDYSHHLSNNLKIGLKSAYGYMKLS
jgi:hypothetical protein